MKFITRIILAALGMMFFLYTVSFAQKIDRQVQTDEQVIRIETSLVRISFIAPTFGNTNYEVFDGDRKVEDYKIISPANETKIDWVFFLDVNPKEQKRFAFAPLRRHLKAVAKSLSAPTVIVNLERLTLEKARSIAGIPDEWTVIPAKNTEDGWQIAEQRLNSLTASRKAFFWLTTEEPTMSSTLLNKMPLGLRDKGVFTYMATMSPAKGKKAKNLPAGERIHLALSNLTLNTSFSSLTLEDLIRIHFFVFNNQCEQLHLIYFQTEEKGKETRIYGRTSASGRILVQNRMF